MRLVDYTPAIHVMNTGTVALFSLALVLNFACAEQVFVLSSEIRLKSNPEALPNDYWHLVQACALVNATPALVLREKSLESVRCFLCESNVESVLVANSDGASVLQVLPDRLVYHKEFDDSLPVLCYRDSDQP